MMCFPYRHTHTHTLSAIAENTTTIKCLCFDFSCKFLFFLYFFFIYCVHCVHKKKFIHNNLLSIYLSLLCCHQNVAVHLLHTHTWVRKTYLMWGSLFDIFLNGKTNFYTNIFFFLLYFSIMHKHTYSF